MACPHSGYAISSTIKKGNYALLSKAAHPDYEGLICGNLRHIDDGENSGVTLAFLGMVGPATEGTLLMLALLASRSAQVVLTLLLAHHGLGKNLNEKERAAVLRIKRLQESAVRYFKSPCLTTPTV